MVTWPAGMCRTCGKPIADNWPYDWHVSCWPDLVPMPGFEPMTGYDVEVRNDLIEIVQWANHSRGRSTQVALGCSEVGQPCLRRTAYKMAGVPAANVGGDGWPATVGTSIHAWVEQAVKDFEAVHSTHKWLTEVEVVPSPLVRGHCDLFDRERHLVLDWKFPSSDNLKKMRKEGVSEQYRVQVQLYGLGHVLAGRRVERVGIAALARQGWLKDMYVWTEPFDRAFAEAALQRIHDLGDLMMRLDILNHPDRWLDIPSAPSRMCSFCPMYKSGITTDSRGCAGV